MAKKAIKAIVDSGEPIHLGPKDAAWVVREDGSMELHLPHLDGDDEATESTVLIAAFGTLKERNPELANRILEEFNDLAEQSDWGKA